MIVIASIAALIPHVSAYQVPEVPDEPKTHVVTGPVNDQPIQLKDIPPYKLVEVFSAMYGVDPNRAKAIIKCESGVRSTSLDDIREYQRTIKTQVPNVVSSASGYFQFINGTWAHTMELLGLPSNTDKHDPVISIQAGVYLLAKEGDGHWSESRSCWSNLV